jgi:hypothetical protein
LYLEDPANLRYLIPEDPEFPGNLEHQTLDIPAVPVYPADPENPEYRHPYIPDTPGIPADPEYLVDPEYLAFQHQ